MLTVPAHSSPRSGPAAAPESPGSGRWHLTPNRVLATDVCPAQRRSSIRVALRESQLLLVVASRPRESTP